MRLPYLSEVTALTRKSIVSFRGLNLGQGYLDGELMECENLSSEQFPCLTQCPARETVGQYETPSSLYSKGGLLVVAGTKVFYEGKEVGTVTEGRKQIAALGNYILIFPDKVYYDVEEQSLHSMEETYTAAELTFAADSITTTGENWPFRAGDAVEISGCTAAPENNKTPIIREVSDKTLTFYDNTFTAGTEEGEVTVKRKIPDLDFICESGNRLWGTEGNTIYASKYADPLNFFVYDGLNGDSYCIHVGSDGPFTGCIPYASHICFFKENTLHKLYGSKPSNYQVVTASVYGVQAGCERSLCVVNEQLLYKGVNGVYTYAGGVPELISEKFGTVRFSDAAAACDGEHYYISMKQGERWGLYVYDVLRGIWLREDDTRAVDLTVHNGQIYLLESGGALTRIDRARSREDIPWSLTFCPFHENIQERKGYSRFQLRAELGEDAWLEVEMQTDRDGRWQRVYTTHQRRRRTMTIPIYPNRCDTVTIRVRGKGECLLKSFVRDFTVGSDV